VKIARFDTKYFQLAGVHLSTRELALLLAFLASMLVAIGGRHLAPPTLADAAAAVQQLVGKETPR
jgi:hypothetical protein